jgi:hypothetical protein
VPRAFVAACVALCAALALVVPAAAPASGAPSSRVIVYGDSVVAGAEDQIAARLAQDGWAPEVVAYPGTDVGHIAAKAFAEPRITDVVVLAVGYTYFWKPFVLRRQIDEAMSALTARGVRRVIWLNVRENRAERRDVNEAIRAAARRWPMIDVADWNSFSRGHRAAFERDGYHLVGAGGTLMGELVARHLVGYRMGWYRSSGPDYGPRPTIRSVVRAFGGPDATALASRAAKITRRSPAVGIAPSASGRGYWIAHRNGTVDARGDATRHGSITGSRLRAPVVGIAATPSGQGYWLAGADGSVYPFGDATFHGSTGTIRLQAPVVGIAPTRTGRGYWLVAADGGVFSFGDARFRGSTGGIALAQPIVGIAPHPDAHGYWLVAYDGGIFAFGSARFHGAASDAYRYWKIQGITPTRDGRGYWLLAANGELHRYGSARLRGAPGSSRQLYVAMTARPNGGLFVLGQQPA